MNERFSYFLATKKTIEDYKVKATFVVDVILPQIKQAISNSEKEYTKFVNASYSSFFKVIVDEYTGIYTTFAPKYNYLVNIQNEFSEYLSMGIEEDFLTENFHEFDQLLEETLQKLNELADIIKSELLLIEKKLQENSNEKNII